MRQHGTEEYDDLDSGDGDNSFRGQKTSIWTTQQVRDKNKKTNERKTGPRDKENKYHKTPFDPPLYELSTDSQRILADHRNISLNRKSKDQYENEIKQQERNPTMQQIGWNVEYEAPAYDIDLSIENWQQPDLIYGASYCDHKHFHSSSKQSVGDKDTGVGYHTRAKQLCIAGNQSNLKVLEDS